MNNKMYIVIYLKNKRKRFAKILVNDKEIYDEFNKALIENEDIVTFGQISFDKKMFYYSKLIIK